jgi:hypothetical protein
MTPPRKSGGETLGELDAPQLFCGVLHFGWAVTYTRLGP